MYTKFDSSKKPGERLVNVQLWSGDDVKPDQMYNLITTEYIAAGKDGFESITDPKVVRITDEDGACGIHNIMRG